MMKSPVANWHFVKWLAQRYDGKYHIDMQIHSTLMVNSLESLVQDCLSDSK